MITIEREYMDNHLHVEITLYSTGKLAYPIWSEIANFQFYYDDEDWDCRFFKEGKPSLMMPGETHRGYMIFLSFDYHGILYGGEHFLLRKGQYVIGEGVVLQSND